MASKTTTTSARVRAVQDLRRSSASAKHVPAARKGTRRSRDAREFATHD